MVAARTEELRVIQSPLERVRSARHLAAAAVVRRCELSRSRFCGLVVLASRGGRTTNFFQDIKRLTEEVVACLVVRSELEDEEIVRLIKLLFEVRCFLRLALGLGAVGHAFVDFLEHHPMLAAVMHHLCDLFPREEAEVLEEILQAASSQEYFEYEASEAGAGLLLKAQLLKHFLDVC